MRPSRSTRATSPSRDAFSSRDAKARSVSAPRCGWIALVQPADMADLVPEPVERRRRVEIRVDLRCPVGRWAGHDVPVDRAVVRHLVPFFDAREDVTAESLRIEVVEETRCGR